MSLVSTRELQGVEVCRPPSQKLHIPGWYGYATEHPLRDKPTDGR